jgi:hypothetical protein
VRKKNLFKLTLLVIIVAGSVYSVAEAQFSPATGSSYYMYYIPVINGSATYVGAVYLGGGYNCTGELCGQPWLTETQNAVTFVHYPIKYLEYRDWVQDLKQKFLAQGIEKACPAYLVNNKFSDDVFQAMARNQSKSTAAQARQRVGTQRPCEVLASLFDINTNVDYTGHILRWYMYEEYIHSLIPLGTYTITARPQSGGEYDQYVQVDLATKEVKYLSKQEATNISLGGQQVLNGGNPAFSSALVVLIAGILLFVVYRLL